jgi:hypothetical protein
MKREILLPHEATATAAKNGLAGLPELAKYLHLQKGIQRGDAVINMDHSDDPTSSVGFWFNPAAGEGGILMATAGASHEENVLEGVRFRFQAHEAAEARAALLAELSLHDEPATGATWAQLKAAVTGKRALTSVPTPAELAPTF